MLIAIQCYAVSFWNRPGSLFFSAYSAKVRFASFLHYVYDCFFPLTEILWLCGTDWELAQQQRGFPSQWGLRGTCSKKLQFSLQLVWRKGSCKVWRCALNLPVIFLLLKLLLHLVDGLGLRSDFFPWYFTQDRILRPKSNETVQLLWL